MKSYYEKSDGDRKRDAIMRRRELIWREEEEIRAWEEANEKKNIHAKLEVSQPDEPLEKEADEVARKVVDGGDASQMTISSVSDTVQTKSEGSGTLYADDSIQRQLDSSKGSGQVMDDSTKSEMETKMGADFSGVKIHTDSAANQMSESVNAKAFTHGQDIYFKSLKYDPKSSEGKNLLAHELHHTRQNGNGVQRKVWRQPLTQDTAKKDTALTANPFIYSGVSLPIGSAPVDYVEKRRKELYDRLDLSKTLYPAQTKLLSPEQAELNQLSSQLGDAGTRKTALELLYKKGEQGWGILLAATASDNAETKKAVTDELKKWVKTRAKFSAYIKNLSLAKDNAFSGYASRLLIDAGQSGLVNKSSYITVTTSKLNQAKKDLPESIYNAILSNTVSIFTSSADYAIGRLAGKRGYGEPDLSEVIDISIAVDLALSQFSYIYFLTGKINTYCQAFAQNKSAGPYYKFSGYLRDMASAVSMISLTFDGKPKKVAEEKWAVVMEIAGKIDAEIAEAFPAFISTVTGDAIKSTEGLINEIGGLSPFAGYFNIRNALREYQNEFKALQKLTGDFKQTLQEQPAAFADFWQHYSTRFAYINARVNAISVYTQLRWAMEVFDTYSKYDLLTLGYQKILLYSFLYQLSKKHAEKIQQYAIYDSQENSTGIIVEMTAGIVSAKEFNTIISQAGSRAQDINRHQAIADWCHKIGVALITLATAYVGGEFILGALGLGGGAAAEASVLTLEGASLSWQIPLFEAMVHSGTFVAASKTATQMQGGNPQWENFGEEYLKTLALFGVLGEVNRTYNAAFRTSVNSFPARILFESGKLVAEVGTLTGVDYVYHQLSPEERANYNFTQALIDNITLCLAVRLAMVVGKPISTVDEAGFPYQKKQAIKDLDNTIQQQLKSLEERAINPEQYARLRKNVIDLCRLRAFMLEEMATSKNYAQQAKILKAAANNFRLLAADLEAEIVASLNVRPAANLPGVKYFDGSPKELERHLKTSDPKGSLVPSDYDPNTYVFTNQFGVTETYINTRPELSSGASLRQVVEAEGFNFNIVKKLYGSDGSAEMNLKLKKDWVEKGWRPEKGEYDKELENQRNDKNNTRSIVKRIGRNKFGTKEIPIEKVQKIHGVPKKGTPQNHIENLANDFKTNGYNLESGPPIEGYEMPDGKIIIIDGHHRLAALETLGETSIPIRVHPQLAPEGLRLYLKIGEYSGFYPPETYPKDFVVPDFGKEINSEIDLEARTFVENNF